MAAGKTLMDLLKVQIARALAARSASPLILSGTLAFAGLSAAALTPSHYSPAAVPTSHIPLLNLDSPHTFCYPPSADDGHTICHVLASQVSTVPTLGCMADPDGDGTYICDYLMDPAAAQ